MTCDKIIMTIIKNGYIFLNYLAY